MDTIQRELLSQLSQDHMETDTTANSMDPRTIRELLYRCSQATFW